MAHGVLLEHEFFLFQLIMILQKNTIWYKGTNNTHVYTHIVSNLLAWLNTDSRNESTLLDFSPSDVNFLASKNVQILPPMIVDYDD